jgi:hypothetical protein
VPCEQFLDRVDGAHLDCVSDALAVLLARYGVPDVQAPFAEDWRFDVVERAGEPPTVDLPPHDQDDLLARRTGLRPSWTPIGSVAEATPCWYSALRDGDPVVLVGDAYGLPWLPYYRHEHMEHGFVLAGLDADGTAQVVDPYQNATEWGRATPVATRLPLAALGEALSGGRWAVLRRVPPTAAARPPQRQITANACAVLAADRAGAYRRFVSYHSATGVRELENLTLQTWLLARNRGLHAGWVANLPNGTVTPDVVDRFRALDAGWRRAAETSYLALRRVRAGRQAPGAALAALTAVTAAEVELARDLAAGEKRS